MARAVELGDDWELHLNGDTGPSIGAVRIAENNDLEAPSKYSKVLLALAFFCLALMSCYLMGFSNPLTPMFA